uniref:Ribosome biogenesis protein RLP24 n=1 Tax=Panagrellus redivivus TaxID=6233 RepID=A0A7E4VWD7_PANRE
MVRRKQKQPKKWKYVEIDQAVQENGPPAVTEEPSLGDPLPVATKVVESSSKPNSVLDKVAKSVLTKKLKREAKRVQLEAARQRRHELRLAKKRKIDKSKAISNE